MLVVGLGNELRGDDGAGIEVARRVRERSRPTEVEVRELPGDPTALLDAWEGHEAVVAVDTMRSGAPPGTIRRLDASREPLPTDLCGSTSTHAVGLGEAIELARALGRLPASLVVYAVEGRRFDAGAGLSAKVESAVSTLTTAVLREASERSSRRGGAAARQ